MAIQGLKTFLALVAGILLAFALIFVAQMLGNQIDPMVAAPDPLDEAALELQIPLLNSAALLAGWFVGAFAGGWLSMRISNSASAGWIVAGAVMGAAVYRALTIGDAYWIIAAGFLLPLAGAWLAGRAARLAN